jgi:hypothetical protein
VLKCFCLCQSDTFFARADVGPSCAKLRVAVTWAWSVEMWARRLECEWAMGMGAVTWAQRPECDGLHYGSGGRGVGLTWMCNREWWGWNENGNDRTRNGKGRTGNDMLPLQP